MGFCLRCLISSCLMVITLLMALLVLSASTASSLSLSLPTHTPTPPDYSVLSCPVRPSPFSSFLSLPSSLSLPPPFPPLFPLPLFPFSLPPVLDIGFHRHHPDNLFTCSQDGSLWHWSGSQSHPQTHPQSGTLGHRDDSAGMAADTRPWLGAVGRGKPDICSLLPSNRFPVNSCHVEPSSNSVVAVTDGGTMYVVPDMTVY